MIDNSNRTQNSLNNYHQTLSTPISVTDSRRKTSVLTDGKLPRFICSLIGSDCDVRVNDWSMVEMRISSVCDLFVRNCDLIRRLLEEGITSDCFGTLRLSMGKEGFSAVIEVLCGVRGNRIICYW